ncbi:MAG: hypothetical protein N2114_04590 [Candidatus Goldbacteria bacterium]|nr:hypothetical protein [Candidatus Goldiibacteriota bacterium]
MIDEKKNEKKENINIGFQEEKTAYDQKKHLEIEEIEVEDLVIDGICGVY